MRLLKFFLIDLFIIWPALYFGAFTDGSLQSLGENLISFYGVFTLIVGTLVLLSSQRISMKRSGIFFAFSLHYHRERNRGKSHVNSHTKKRRMGDIANVLRCFNQAEKRKLPGFLLSITIHPGHHRICQTSPSLIRQMEQAIRWI